MSWRKALHVLVISILLVGGFITPSGAQASKILAKATAATHTVCASGCDFSSIQAAIDSGAVDYNKDLWTQGGAGKVR